MSLRTSSSLLSSWHRHWRRHHHLPVQVYFGGFEVTLKCFQFNFFFTLGQRSLFGSSLNNHEFLFEFFYFLCNRWTWLVESSKIILLTAIMRKDVKQSCLTRYSLLCVGVTGCHIVSTKPNNCLVWGLVKVSNKETLCGAYTMPQESHVTVHWTTHQWLLKLSLGPFSLLV